MDPGHHMMNDDSDSDCSEATANSTAESNDESLGDNVEVAKILDHKFHLPKDLCEHSEIFQEFFSLDTWQQLSDDERRHLTTFLPKFPENNEQEREETVHQLFANTLTLFEQSPLDSFHSNLQDGNYRPDIAHYRKGIQKAEEREQRIQECERISLLAERLVSSREKLLRSAYRCPAGSFPQLPQSSTQVPRLSSSSATMRANRRYFQEISKLNDTFGFSLSDDETMPEGMQVQLTKKQIKQLSEPGSLSPGADMRIFSTTSTREKNWDHLANSAITETRYKQMLQSYRKRKLIEPDQPEMEIDDIKLKDIFARTQLTINPRKLVNNTTYAKKALLIDPSRIKQEPSYPTGRLGTQSNPLILGKNVKLTGKNAIGRVNMQERSFKTFGSQSETDEEDWIKANIIKIEPNEGGPIKNNPKLAVRPATKIKTIYPQQPGNIIVSRKRPGMEASQIRAGKKIVLDSSSVMKNSYTMKTNTFGQNKRIIINRPTVVMNPDDLIDDTDADEANNSPETRNEMQACFLSLIRDIFCSTRDHRMKLEVLRYRINLWMANPFASMNDWYSQAADWSVLLISAVHFLSGEFQGQPEGFVPYLEFKSQLNIYQWIGAGRDSDTRMVPLCQYWLGRRNEMGIKASNQFKHKVISKTITSPEKNEDNHLLQAVSPPIASCRTDWRVQPATDDEIQAFRVQERHRYENPHLPFTFCQHGYESVVGPLKGYSQSPAASKARDNNTLVAERPHFVTILALVRDATARLPNGEGTRWDICELLKSSQYLLPGTSDAVLQTVVSGALDRIHAEPDPCVKFDTKRKLWVYVHRNRSENDFERLQQTAINRQKKPVLKKTKTELMPIATGQMRVVTTSGSMIRPYQTTKLTPTTSNLISTAKPSPPLVKIPPKRFIKTIGNERSMEAFDVEASLDAHTTPIVKTADPKARLANKNFQQMSPIRIVTSSPSIGSYVQSSPGTQTVYMNANRAQSPKVTQTLGARKIAGKPVIFSQNQTLPLASQSSPNSNQSYVSVNVNASKLGNTTSPLSLQGKMTQVQPRNVIKVNQVGGKNVMNPQQKIILTSSAMQGQKGGKIISTMTVPKNQSPVTMLSQQKQILTNVIVQQQKAKGQNQLLLTGNQQKMPSLTISTSGTSTTSPQVIQIQQASSDGKITTMSPANLTPQQRQTLFQSLKQFKGNPQTMVVKSSQVTRVSEAPPLVSVSGNVGKIIKTGTTMVQQQPQVIVSLAQKIEGGNLPIMARVVTAGGRQILDGKTTFKIAGGTAGGQSGLIQISGAPGTNVTQYAVVSKGKNIISLNNQQKFITTQANILNNASTTTSSQQITTQGQPIKIMQGGSITAQQLIGAKLINVQTLANKGIKTTGGIKMINSQNYIANIGGKPMIIAGKSNATGTTNATGGQGLVLQAGNASNGGAFILNSQGQQLKVQGNILTQGNVNVLNQPMTSQPQTVMLGNQIVKVQSLNQQKIGQGVSVSNANTDGQRPIILGSTIKVLKNVIKTNPQQQQSNRVMLAAPGTQTGQFSQQIILPANFQGIKTLQGLKVIPMGQQASSDRVFTTRLVSNTSTATNNNNNANKLNMPVTSTQEDVKE